jgi:hypothetical protein
MHGRTIKEIIALGGTYQTSFNQTNTNNAIKKQRQISDSETAKPTKPDFAL